MHYRSAALFAGLASTVLGGVIGGAVGLATSLPSGFAIWTALIGAALGAIAGACSSVAGAVVSRVMGRGRPWARLALVSLVSGVVTGAVVAIPLGLTDSVGSAPIAAGAFLCSAALALVAQAVLEKVCIPAPA